MLILGLDLSLKPGFAVLDSERGLVAYGTKRFNWREFDGSVVDDFVKMYQAKEIASFIKNLVEEYEPDEIWIEQTNAGSFRNSQKLLEFIHFAVLDKIKLLGCKEKVGYVDTSAWSSLLKIRQTKEDTKNNALVREKKKRGKITKKHLSVRWANASYGLTLKLKDNDAAEAIAIATYGLKKRLLKEKLKNRGSVDLNKALGILVNI